MKEEKIIAYGKKIRTKVKRSISSIPKIPAFFATALNRLFHEQLEAAAVVPAYNEAGNIKRIVKTLKSIPELREVIVVDDGSTDETAKHARAAGARVVRHAKNLGKGAAIKTGIANAREEVILFVDADLQNVSPENFRKLVLPVIEGDADFVKSSFGREGGRVTELTVRPLLKFFFPNVSFTQPISGQFCAKKEFLEKIEIESDYGIDIGLLLDAVAEGQRIKEVDIGWIEHRQRPLSELKETSEQVVHAILKRAGVLERKHKLVAFDLDQTLINERSIDVFARELGFAGNLRKIRAGYEKSKTPEHELSRKLARLFAGKREYEAREACDKMTLAKNAAEVIRQLKKQGYKTAIISQAFSPAADYFREKLGCNDAINPVLKTRNGRFTGAVAFPCQNKRPKRGCSRRAVCKLLALKRIAKKYGATLRECVAVGNSEGDACMLKEAGIGIAINADEQARKSANLEIENLAEILALID